MSRTFQRGANALGVWELPRGSVANRVRTECRRRNRSRVVPHGESDPREIRAVANEPGGLTCSIRNASTRAAMQTRVHRSRCASGRAGARSLSFPLRDGRRTRIGRRRGDVLCVETDRRAKITIHSFSFGAIGIQNRLNAGDGFKRKRFQ